MCTGLSGGALGSSSSMPIMGSLCVDCCDSSDGLGFECLDLGWLRALLSSSGPVPVDAYLVRFRVPSSCSLSEGLKRGLAIRACGLFGLGCW